MNRTSSIASAALLVLAPAAFAARFSEPRDIDNRYLPLAKFARCEFRGSEDGSRIRVVRRLLDRTRTFEHRGRTVRAAVIEDREFEDGELIERTLDYFAQSDGGTVHYLGEHVDNYENGRVVDHHGTWLYGKHTQTLGVAMPARPRVGDRWRNEDVPGITVERDRAVAILERVQVRGTTYRNVLRVRERTGGETEYKLYAPGVGNIRERPPEGHLELVRCKRKERS
jgi:hypothetical protein